MKKLLHVLWIAPAFLIVAAISTLICWVIMVGSERTGIGNPGYLVASLAFLILFLGGISTIRMIYRKVA